MPERAQVTSLEAIDSFRSNLLVFLVKARAVIEEVGDHVQRTGVWLQHDRRTYWEKEYQRRSRDLGEAQQALVSAKLSSFQTATAVQSMAVERARRSLRDAEEKRDRVKRWTREFENRTGPLVKQVDQLQGFLTTDLVKAAAYLERISKTLEAYAAAGAPLSEPSQSRTAEPAGGDIKPEPQEGRGP